MKKINEPTIFLGDGVEIYRKEIIKTLKTKAKFAPKHLWGPRASIIATLAMEKLNKGKEENTFDLVPMYLYPSTVQVKR